MTYRGQRSEVVGFGGSRTTGPFDRENPFRYSLKGYWFHFPIPTPVFAAGRPSTLHRVFVLWKGSSSHVSPVVVQVFDGPTRVDALEFATGPGRSGEGGRADLVDGITRFHLRRPHPPIWGINLAVGVSFREDGDITFYAAGADFDI